MASEPKKQPELVDGPGGDIQVVQDPVWQQEEFEEAFALAEHEQANAEQAHVLAEQHNPVVEQQDDALAKQNNNPVVEQQGDALAEQNNNPVVEQQEQNNNPVVEQQDDDQARLSLETLIGENRWEEALRRLERMVRDGEANNGPVPTAPSHDIYRAHPELVLLLRGEEYLRIKRLPNAAADATRFYHKHIQNLYRSGTTGSSFVDTGVLKDIQDWENGSRATPSGHQSEIHMQETRQAVNDYLKLYFPAYRPQILRVNGRSLSRAGELGEKIQNNCRCLACHKRFNSWSVSNLKNHIQGLRQEKDGKQCPAFNNYILDRLKELLALDNKAKKKPPKDQERARQPTHGRRDDGGGDGAAPAAAAGLSAAS
uniref:Uncharacterized protein n=1 Tax=Oryza barthii TaxID=65489 RepID=A0A0D3HTA2_9ORYZ